MNGRLGGIVFTSCNWDSIRESVQRYYAEHNILADAFWEDHVRKSNFYRMEQGGAVIGWFAVYAESILTLFWVCPEYADAAQELFFRARKYESVREAFVPTGDEFFLGLAMDYYTAVEKQAYFFRYTQREARDTIPNIVFTPADLVKDAESLNRAEGFFDDDLKNIRSGVAETLFLAKQNGTFVGFGVAEYAAILPGFASIGMYVLREHRQKGIACGILTALQDMVKTRGLTPISGCWYYNHNSKKSLESAGAYAASRLLRFHF